MNSPLIIYQDIKYIFNKTAYIILYNLKKKIVWLCPRVEESAEAGRFLVAARDIAPDEVTAIVSL